jgi:PAS domain S-box-containing protein
MSNTRILIAEDEGLTAAHLQDSLQKMGYTVLAIARSGKETVNQVTQMKPDLILMDIGLAPVSGELEHLNGIQASQHIHQQLDVPIVYLTAYSDEATLQRALATTPYGYIIKPFEDRELRATIETALRIHRLKRQLWASEEKYRLLVENASEAISAIDDEGKFLVMNRAAAQLFGGEASDLISKTLWDVLPHQLADERMEDAKQVMQSGQGHSIEVCIPTQGQARWLHQSTQPIRGASGQVNAILSLSTDITERKQAEAEIVRLQHLLQNIADSMPSALITLDLDGKVMTWNPAAEALIGKTMSQMQGKLLWQACPELDCYRDLFKEVLRTGQIIRRHRESLVTEDETIYRDVSVFPLTANEIQGVVMRIDDVTPRVRLEEMMLQATKMASVGGLAAGVAHEINNPLAVMMQSAQVLQLAFDTQRPSTRERLQAHEIQPDHLQDYLQERGLIEYLEGIRSAGGRAAKIVADLLSFSRKSSFQLGAHDLNALVEQVLELAAIDYDLKKKYDFRNIHIVREMAPDLPQVFCDGQQIQQVVLNLVRNAAQALAGEIEANAKRSTADREWKPRLTLRTRLVEAEQLAPAHLSHVASASLGRRQLRLEVEDNGPGISKEERRHLFEPFSTSKKVGEGTGLGLWLCWSIIVERHKGRIWVEDAKEGGARFIIELPLGKDAAG